MEKEFDVRPVTQIVCGYVLAAVFWYVLIFVHLSESMEVVASIGESLAIGIGSIGIGRRLTQGRRKGER